MFELSEFNFKDSFLDDEAFLIAPGPPHMPASTLKGHISAAI